MDTIVGKLYLVVLLCSGTVQCVSGSLTLRLTNMQHQEIKEVGIGQPFMLEVILKGDAVSQKEPLVKNLDAIYGRRLGYQMNSINGNTTVTYTYKARVDQEGTYVVGPVLAGNYQADPFTVVVGQSAQLVHKKTTKKQKAFLQFFIDSHDVVVSEIISCRLRFLFNDNAVSLKHIGQQDIPGFIQSAVQGPVYGVEEIKGKMFNYAEWSWTLGAKDGGHYIIPAYYADYFIKKNQHSFWGSFAHLLDDHDVKRIYSNAEKITVHSFEDAPYPVCAVGKNITIKASVDSAVVKQSEGMVLRIDTRGDAESSLRGVQELMNMPLELKWYRSNTIKLEDNTERTEFVIQGLKSGDYEIPPQKLCYFDRVSREYVLLETEPLIISVSPLADTTHHVPSSGAHNKKLEEVYTKRKSIGNQLPLSRSCWKNVKRIEPLPWWIVIVLLVSSGGVIMVSSLKILFRKFFYGDGARQSYNNIINHTLYAIKNAQREHMPEKLYALFMQLLSVRCAIPTGAISLDRIEHELYNRFVDEKIRMRLQTFLKELEEVAFGGESMKDKEIFSHAIEWVTILKKIV